jgi:hypothetical protein
MRFDKNQNIEELLNGFIDGELSAQETEQVRQLIEKDPAVANRLREIETCRVLVSSLPPAEPPAMVVSGIKKLVHGKWSQGVRVDYSHSSGSGPLKLSRGRWYLLSRQLIAASVVIGLLGVLAGVIFKIVSPEQGATRIAATAPQPKVENLTQNAEKIGVYSLKLTTADFAGVNAYINKLLEESTWLEFRRASESRLTGRQSVYTVYCSKAGLDELMTNLTTVWSRFDSTTFVVQNDSGGQVAIDDVRPEQVTDIARQDTTKERIRLARELAVMNDVRRQMPQEKVLALGNKTELTPELSTIPKPVLTSGNNNAVPPKGALDQIQVDLSIVLSSNK